MKYKFETDDKVEAGQIFKAGQAFGALNEIVNGDLRQWSRGKAPHGFANVTEAIEGIWALMFEILSDYGIDTEEDYP